MNVKEYLKMADVFNACDVVEADVKVLFAVSEEYDDGVTAHEYAHHAIQHHDELVAEVERLRRQLSDAFMAGWEEGINGMDNEEAEKASIEISLQFSRNGGAS